MPESASPDLRARWVLMSAYLYYRRGSPLLHDTYYDRLVRELVSQWDQLEMHRTWALGGDPRISSASGHTFKITRACEAGALAWWERHSKGLPHGEPVDEDEWREGGRFGDWVSAEPVGREVRVVRERAPRAAVPEQLRLL